MTRGAVAAVRRFQDYRGIAAGVTAGVCCAVAAFIAGAPIGGGDRSRGIRLEFERGAIGLSSTWPISAAADCAAWLREVLY